MSTERARQLRRDSTWAERRLWRVLRSRRLAGYKFRRQRIEGRYYLDFYCHEAKVVVELDGSGHGFPDQQQHDASRDAWLAARGILVKRVWNHQLVRTEGRENLVENLWRLLQERAPHPDNVPPPPYRRAPDKPGSPPEPSP
ncbi:MAG: DUF559 domain-containing protein [Verrucomicrobia bacterium]|nr:MAG: DUF559 domain-containing protein [Verrucomicrobiota bacterium]